MHLPHFPPWRWVEQLVENVGKNCSLLRVSWYERTFLWHISACFSHTKKCTGLFCQGLGGSGGLVRSTLKYTCTPWKKKRTKRPLANTVLHNECETHILPAAAGLALVNKAQTQLCSTHQKLERRGKGFIHVSYQPIWQYTHSSWNSC